MIDARAELKRADRFLADGKIAEALAAYALVARAYDTEGFALKSIAIWKQVRTIIGKSAHHHVDLASEARASLVLLYRKLGLEHDALAIEAEPFLSH